MKRKGYFDIIRRKDGKYDWRRVAGNGVIQATSCNQGFDSPSKAERAIVSLIVGMDDSYNMDGPAGWMLEYCPGSDGEGLEIRYPDGSKKWLV